MYFYFLCLKWLFIAQNIIRAICICHCVIIIDMLYISCTIHWVGVVTLELWKISFAVWLQKICCMFTAFCSTFAVHSMNATNFAKLFGYTWNRIVICCKTFLWNIIAGLVFALLFQCYHNSCVTGHVVCNVSHKICICFCFAWFCSDYIDNLSWIHKNYISFPYFNIKSIFSDIGIPIVNITWSWDQLMFIMGSLYW